MTVLASRPGDTYEDAYLTGYTAVVVEPVGDTAHATDAVTRAGSRRAAAADSAPASDGVQAILKPRQVRTAGDTAGASDHPVAAVVRAPGTATDVGGLHLRVHDVTGTQLLSVIPDLETATVQDERNAPGQLSASVPLSGAGVGVLAGLPAGFISLWEQGRRVGTFVYDEDDSDEADANGPDAELQITAPGVMEVLSWAALYPQGGFGTPPYHDFVNVTPGAVLLRALGEAQSRGALDGVNGPLVTCSFSADADSDGTPWPATVWVRYDAGKTVLDVATDLAGRGYVDVRMRGFTLDAYVGGGSPNTASSTVPAPTSVDAQGWAALKGCAVVRDAATVPTNVPGVTASTKVTGQIAVVEADAAAVATAKAAYDAASAAYKTLSDGLNKAATKAHRKLTTAEKQQINAANRAVTAAQKAYSDTQDEFNAHSVDATDAWAVTTVPIAVQPLVTYDAGIAVHAEAVTRVVELRVAFTDAGGGDLGTVSAGALTDSPTGWQLLAAQVVAPPAAAHATLQVRYVGVNDGENHWHARAVLSPATGTSVSKDLPAVVLHRPAYVQQSQRRRQRSAIITAELGIGEGNLSLEALDRDAIALYGRREGGGSQGGVADYATLQRLTQLDLQQKNRPKVGWTVTYARQTGDADVPVPQPGRDYSVGNLVRCEWVRHVDVDPTSTDTSFMPLRVSTITRQYDAGGVATAEVELADIFEDHDVMLARQVQGVLMGASSANPLGVDTSSTDTTPPQAVAAAFVTSDVFLNADGTYQAVATVAWPAPTQNTDGTPFDDLGAYTVDFRLGYWASPDDGWQGHRSTQGTTASFGSLPPDAVFEARVLVADYNGNYPTLPDGSPAYTYSEAVVLKVDTDAPAAPGKPTVTALAGGLAVGWSGLDVAGVQMPPDYGHVEIHLSSVRGFTPSPATLVDVVYGPPALVTSTLAPPLLQYGVAYTVRLVAVDSSGNHSQPGLQSDAVAMRLIGPPDLDPSVLTDTDHSAMLSSADGWAGTGSHVTDGSARDGQAWQLGAGQAVGADYAGLKAGRYRATFVLRTDAVAGSSPASLADANVTGASVLSDAVRTATTADARTGQGYRAVSVTFTVQAAGAVIHLSLANAYTAGTVWLSHAYVEPVTSLGVAEVRDLNVADMSATKLTAGILTADVVAAADANGKPGRIRVGIIDPVTGQPNAAGFSMGADGLRGQAPGGAQTLLLDPTTGQIQLTGSIQAGSTLPGSVYAANLVQNPSFEDPVIGTVAGTAGVVPLAWTDAWQTIGNASVAYADQGTPLGGSQSLTIRLDDTGSGRGVSSAAFPVLAGERLQVAAMLKEAGPLAPIYVRLHFGTTPTFTRTTSTIGATGAVPDNCQVMTLDGTVVNAGPPTAAHAGYTDVLAAWTPPAAGTPYKVAGSVVVPPGATWCRLVLFAWTRGTGAGSTYAMFDNTSVIRSQDGHTMVAATITGPVLQTASSGPRIVIESTSDARSITLWGTNQTSMPAQIQQTDYVGLDGLTHSAVTFIADDSGVAPVIGGFGVTQPYTSRGQFSVTPDGIDFRAYYGQGRATPSARLQVLGQGAPIAGAGNTYGTTGGGVMLAAFGNDGSLFGELFIGAAMSADYGRNGALEGANNTIWGGLAIRRANGQEGGGLLAFNVWVGNELDVYNVYVDGALKVWSETTGGFATKTFVIDHPTDRSRWLVHAAVEGPEAAVMYRGEARLERGVAVVELPAYFEAATRKDGRTVQVTPIVDSTGAVGSADDVAYAAVGNLAATAVADGRFTVYCASGMLVADQLFHWEVKAVRADVAPLEAEPARAGVVAHGDGPYRWLEPARHGGPKAVRSRA